MLSESEIYVYTKEFLKEQGWELVGGEPPGGTDELPRIEIKDPEYRKKGSNGSKKVDLIAQKSGNILLLELKPCYHSSDVSKLDDIEGRKDLRREFYKSCKERDVIEDIDEMREEIISGDCLIKGLGISKRHKVPGDFILVLAKDRGNFEVIEGSNIESSHLFNCSTNTGSSPLDI